MKKINLIIALLLLCFVAVKAEDANEYIRKGNKNYKDKKFNDAEVNYRKSMDADSKNDRALFNLGDALYKQGNYKEATDKFTQYAAQAKNKGEIASAYHNLGNSLLMQKQYKESIDAYKKALKSSPSDKATKYNLEYARSMLTNEQQKQKQKQEPQKVKHDDKSKDTLKVPQNNQDSKNDDKKGGKIDQESKSKISKDDAQRILNALQNEESKVQKKVRKLNAKKAKLEKNW